VAAPQPTSAAPQPISAAPMRPVAPAVPAAQPVLVKPAASGNRPIAVPRTQRDAEGRSVTPLPLPQRRAVGQVLWPDPAGPGGTEAAAAAATGERFYDELRGGLLDHDTGVFDSSVEDGIDVNIELLFGPSAFLGAIGSPRPHIGASINTSNDTSQAYFGVTWDWMMFDQSDGSADGLFFEASVGGALHDGETDDNDSDSRNLGCRIVPRGALAFGYAWDAHYRVMLGIDYITDAGICGGEDGLANVGLRVGYKF
jgi:lipid A 3-O-deacylase